MSKKIKTRTEKALRLRAALPIFPVDVFASGCPLSSAIRGRREWKRNHMVVDCAPLDAPHDVRAVERSICDNARQFVRNGIGIGPIGPTAQSVTLLYAGDAPTSDTLHVCAGFQESLDIYLSEMGRVDVAGTLGQSFLARVPTQAVRDGPWEHVVIWPRDGHPYCGPPVALDLRGRLRMSGISAEIRMRE